MTDAASHRELWDEAQRTALRGCVGQKAQGAFVCEMALCGPDEDPVFSRPEVCFIQAAWLKLSIEGGEPIRFSTCQDDDQFALRIDHWPHEAMSALPSGSIYRMRSLAEFPVGEIEKVQWRLDERGDIQEILLTISGRAVVLRAGEVEEQLDGRLIVRDRDESVLLFLDSDSYRQTDFGSPECSVSQGSTGLSALNS